MTDGQNTAGRGADRHRTQPSLLSRAGRAARTVITGWALLGGLILAALVLMTAASALSNLAFNQPFAPDYELTKHLVAVAVFTFLPYCQMTGANVSVDIFTERMSARAKAAMGILAALFAIGFSVVLFVQMVDGLRSYIRFQEVTAVLKLPLWTAFPPILVSLVLLLIAACISLAEAWRAIRKNQPAQQRTDPINAA